MSVVLLVILMSRVKSPSMDGPYSAHMATRLCLAHGVRRTIGYAPCHLLNDEFSKVSLADSSSGHLRTGTRLGGTDRGFNRPNDVTGWLIFGGVVLLF